MKQIRANIESVSSLTETVLQVILKPEHYIDYQAGQYLQIVVDDEIYSYSIANAPLGSHRYELHIRHGRDTVHNKSVLNEIKNGSVLLNVPLGTCTAQNLSTQKPIIFIAAGLGFAPIKAMIEQLFMNNDARSLTLYWGVQTKPDLYMHEKVAQWQDHAVHFSYQAHLSKSTQQSLVAMVLEQHRENIQDYHIVMSGPFELMYLIRDELIAVGVARENLFSDAFSFE